MFNSCAPFPPSLLIAVSIFNITKQLSECHDSTELLDWKVQSSLAHAQWSDSNHAYCMLSHTTILCIFHVNAYVRANRVASRVMA